MPNLDPAIDAAKTLVHAAQPQYCDHRDAASQLIHSHIAQEFLTKLARCDLISAELIPLASQVLFHADRGEMNELSKKVLALAEIFMTTEAREQSQLKALVNRYISVH